MIKAEALTLDDVSTQDYSSFTRVIFSICIFCFLSFLVLLPLLNSISRIFVEISIPGNATWVQHLTLWLGLLGATIATTQNKHLSVGILKLIKNRLILISINKTITISTTIITLCLGWGATVLVYYQTESIETIGGWFPVWLAQVALPISFLFISITTVLKNSVNWKDSITQFLSIIIILGFFIFAPESITESLTIPGLISIIILAFLGMPIYAVLGGVALLLFYTADIPIAIVPAEAYRLVTQPVLPSIPLFALTGTVLAIGGAPRRLINFIKAWTGGIPGGAALSSIIGCAIFTAITGASGVTILALGSLLLPILLSAKYKKSFSIGLLTASGSVGLLFPPSLPVILYGVYGHVAINRLFYAALGPGILLIFLLILYSVFSGRSYSCNKESFKLKKALDATWNAKGDLLLPILVLIGFFGGFITLVETAALTAFWAILLEVVIYKEINLKDVLYRAMFDSVVMIGALLIVLGMALGLVSYLVDAQIPDQLTAWVTSTIQSKWIFLLILNVILLLVGAVMDIFSAIIVVVPLIVPLGLAFGIDPVHLGVIFLANLELGYLTPPVGMNLFLSSLRFKKSLLEIWRTVIPFLVIFIIWVLLITYIPFISSGISSLILH